MARPYCLTLTAVVHRLFVRRRYERHVENTDDSDDDGVTSPATPTFRRRTVIGAAVVSAVGGAALGAGAVALTSSRTSSGADLWARPDRNGASPVSGLHLQFGGDASTDVVVSWHSGTAAVRNPRVMLGTPGAGLGRSVQAETATYRDAKSGSEIRVNHAHLNGLMPGTD